MLQLLLPALIPSWRFFDRIGPAPTVQFALVESADVLVTGWRDVHPRPAHTSVPTMLGRIFWNPRGNEALYLVSCAERLLDEPTPERVTALVLRVAECIQGEAARESSAATLLRVRIVESMREHGQIVQTVAFVSDAVHLERPGAAGRA